MPYVTDERDAEMGRCRYGETVVCAPVHDVDYLYPSEQNRNNFSFVVSPFNTNRTFNPLKNKNGYKQYEKSVPSSYDMSKKDDSATDCWGAWLGFVVCLILFIFLMFALSYPASYYYYGGNSMDRNVNGIPDHREWPYYVYHHRR